MNAVAATSLQWGAHAPGLLQWIAISLPRSGPSKKIRKWLRKRLSTPDIVDVTRYGLRFRCHIGNNVTERDLVYGGQFDNMVELEKIMGHLPIGGTFVDAGANCGLYSVVAAHRAGPAGRVLAIEANPALVDRIRFNAAINGLNVDVAACAVSDTTGAVEMQICQEELGRSGLTVIEDGPRIAVEARQLYNILVEHGIARVDAMKIDIEGHEDRALIPFLRDAPRSLWPHAILIEVSYAHGWRQGCVLALMDAGYKIEWRGTGDFLLIR
jgi:FkbM family methyltransferase